MHGIERTKERLAGFEKQFGMTSEDFERRFEAGEIRETLDLIDWLGEIKMLQLLNQQKIALEGVTVR